MVYMRDDLVVYGGGVVNRTCKNCEHNPMGVCEKTGKEIGISFVLSRLQKVPAWCPYRRKRK